MAITEERIAEPEKLSDRLSTYFCNKCGYLGKEGPAHLGCNYHAARDRAYQIALDLEAKLEEALRDGERLEWLFSLEDSGASVHQIEFLLLHTNGPEQCRQEIDKMRAALKEQPE